MSVKSITQVHSPIFPRSITGCGILQFPYFGVLVSRVGHPPGWVGGSHPQGWVAQVILLAASAARKGGSGARDAAILQTMADTSSHNFWHVLEERVVLIHSRRRLLSSIWRML